MVDSTTKDAKMKIEQDTLEFKPITITLETREEADAFCQIVDLMDDGLTANFVPRSPAALRRLITEWSDAFTNMDVKL